MAPTEQTRRTRHIWARGADADTWRGGRGGRGRRGRHGRRGRAGGDGIVRAPRAWGMQAATAGCSRLQQQGATGCRRLPQAWGAQAATTTYRLGHLGYRDAEDPPVGAPEQKDLAVRARLQLLVARAVGRLGDGHRLRDREQERVEEGDELRVDDGDVPCALAQARRNDAGLARLMLILEQRAFAHRVLEEAHVPVRGDARHHLVVQPDEVLNAADGRCEAGAAGARHVTHAPRGARRATRGERCAARDVPSIGRRGSRRRRRRQAERARRQRGRWRGRARGRRRGRARWRARGWACGRIAARAYRAGFRSRGPFGCISPTGVSVVLSVLPSSTVLTAYKHKWRKMDVPAIAESVWPLGEKSSSCSARSLSRISSLAAVASHEALSSGSEILIWFLEPSARITPPSPHAPQVIAFLCLPAKCLRLMKVSFDARSQHAKLPSAKPRTSLRVSDHCA